jgi:hypothetical protein
MSCRTKRIPKVSHNQAPTTVSDDENADDARGLAVLTAIDDIEV